MIRASIFLAVVLSASGSGPVIPARVDHARVCAPVEPDLGRSRTPSATARPAPVTVASRVTGIASWYRWHTGEAAAGPALRRMLGAHWRGMVVTVTAGGHSARVRLTDWCGCLGSRIIDLDRATFAALAPLSRGLITVTVSR